MRFLLLALLAATLCGCNLIYKLPTRQGNVIEQKELDKVQLGMTREQVRFVLGTPIAAHSLQPDRWDYLGYYKSPRGEVFNRTVSLYFEGDRLARMVGAEPPAKLDTEQVPAPGDGDAGTDEKPEAPESGIVIKPE